MLHGRIDEKISGETLAAFLDRRIFAPLGMTMTRHTPRTTELVPGLATGYTPTPNGWRRALHNFPLHGEGGLVSSVEDLALWHAQFGLPRHCAEALDTALTTLTPFVNGTPNTYARGLRIKTYRGLRTVGHDGLWPGFKTSFVRVPDHGVAVICISNDATSDPHELAFQVIDGLCEGAHSVHPVPPMPDWAASAELPGRYIDRTTGATVEIARDAKDRVTASVNGAATFLVPTADGRLTTSRGSGDFSLRFDGAAIEVERDAGITETLHRVAPGARLPGRPARKLRQSGHRRDLDHRRHRHRRRASCCRSAAAGFRGVGDRTDRGRHHSHLHAADAVSRLAGHARPARCVRTRYRPARRWRAGKGAGVHAHRITWRGMM